MVCSFPTSMLTLNHGIVQSFFEFLGNHSAQAFLDRRAVLREPRSHYKLAAPKVIWVLYLTYILCDTLLPGQVSVNVDVAYINKIISV